MPYLLIKFSKFLNSKNYSSITIREYCNDLTTFFKFLKQYFELDVDFRKINIFILSRVNEADIFAFLVFLNYSRNNTAITRQRKISCIKTFYNWLFTLKYSCFKDKENPAINIPNITRVQRLPKYLNFEEAKNIQNVFNEQNSKNPIRNNTIIVLFLNTGIRLSSLISLNINDINFKEKKMKIIAKGNKELEILLNKFTIEQLTKYLQTRNDDEEALFLSSRNKRIGRRMVEYICEKAFELVGLANRKYTVHSLRHTAATIYYNSTGGNLLVVKKILGHSSITSTEIYTHVDNHKLKAAINANPLNNYGL